jgi:hypothetical protein
VKRHIIVEGVDGSGKDTLIGQLMDPLQWRGRSNRFVLHERASTSLGGPVDNLGEWVARDATRMAEIPPSIYNRHPLISEPIYRTIRPNKPMVPPFDNAAWVSAYRRIVAREAVLVICQPPLQTVLDTIKRQGRDAHMPGVYENAGQLWTMYSALVWSGTAFRYDYTKSPNALDALYWLLDKNVSI